MNIFTYHLYLLQLENYELGRFWYLLLTRGYFQKGSLRKSLVWTVKARLLFLGAIFIIGIVAGIVYGIGQNVPVTVAALLIAAFLYPVWLSLIMMMLKPLDAAVKNRVVRQAKVKINQLPNVKVIGIAGSYGKTTMKQVVATVLGSKFTVVSTPESINTPVGIARWILKVLGNSSNTATSLSSAVADDISPHPSFAKATEDLREGTRGPEILIVEMGEHYQGDIRELCELVSPDVAMVTGINEAHLERMGNLETTVATIFEIVEFSKNNALIVINGEDENISLSYKNYIRPTQSIAISHRSNVKGQMFFADRLGWEAEHTQLGQRCWENMLWVM
jgi:UDP-N-acetylmuramoyl-tripeptide--D-alanyl-D-alanine ligase